MLTATLLVIWKLLLPLLVLIAVIDWLTISTVCPQYLPQ